MLPFVSLDAATVLGPGVARDLEGNFARHTLVAVLLDPAEPDGASVRLEGSHDGVIWLNLTGITLAFVNGVTQGVVDVNSHLVRYVRAVIVNDQNFTGSPIVRATIASGD